MTLGQRIKTARLEAGLSQKQLCEGVITRNMLSLIENGAASPSMDTLRCLARRLGKPLGWFLEEGAVTSRNLDVMQRARQAAPEEALEILTQYAPPDALFDREYYLLLSLHSLTLARQALAKGKTGLCRERLKDAEEAAKRTPYDTPELRKSRILLAYALDKDRASELENLLERDSEHLLRASAALSRGQYELCRALLFGEESQDAVFLRAESYFQEKNYAFARAEYEKLPGTSQVYARLEQCCRELEDYKQAYFYACKQRS